MQPIIESFKLSGNSLFGSANASDILFDIGKLFKSWPGKYETKHKRDINGNADREQNIYFIDVG